MFDAGNNGKYERKMPFGNWSVCSALIDGTKNMYAEERYGGARSI